MDKKPYFSESEDEYELLPHKELSELKEELRKLKEFEISPTKKMHVTMVELNHKLDKLVTIFEDAMHEVRIEEGGLSFADKMKPLLEKMNKILEQNSEIASGILAVADMVKEIKGEPKLGVMPQKVQPELPPLPGMARIAPPPAQSRELPPPPPPPKRTFGL
ncbi:hypothetical protein KY329_03095 [Candidatus Woesearchaeota archaeon]|nr:hypothetical protein [Candidatus Woesearchaeota archaeon]